MKKQTTVGTVKLFVLEGFGGRIIMESGIKWNPGFMFLFIDCKS
jgi:hypothetical protein